MKKDGNSIVKTPGSVVWDIISLVVWAKILKKKK